MKYRKISTADILQVGIGIGFFGVFIGMTIGSPIITTASLATGIFSGIALSRSTSS